MNDRDKLGLMTAILLGGMVSPMDIEFRPRIGSCRSPKPNTKRNRKAANREKMAKASRKRNRRS